jgi:hypothetical protein
VFRFEPSESESQSDALDISCGRAFEKKAMKRIFGPKRQEIISYWKTCIMMTFIICTLHWV